MALIAFVMAVPMGWQRRLQILLQCQSLTVDVGVLNAPIVIIIAALVMAALTANMMAAPVVVALIAIIMTLPMRWQRRLQILLQCQSLMVDVGVLDAPIAINIAALVVAVLSAIMIAAPM